MTRKSVNRYSVFKSSLNIFVRKHCAFYYPNTDETEFKHVVRSVKKTLNASNMSKAIDEMLFDESECFSPLSQFGDDVTDQLLGAPSSEQNEMSTLSDGGLTCDGCTAVDDVDLPVKKARRKLRKYSTDSGGESTIKPKHCGSVGRRNERERNRVKQVGFRLLIDNSHEALK